jgi:hypothetical protein
LIITCSGECALSSVYLTVSLFFALFCQVFIPNLSIVLHQMFLNILASYFQYIPGLQMIPYVIYLAKHRLRRNACCYIVHFLILRIVLRSFESRLC